MADAHKNFAYSLVAVAPIPATSGTALTVTTGGGTLFPAPPFNATIWQAGANALSTNAEIVRVTAIVGDVLTITRTQESTSARTIVTGDQIADTITSATLQQYVASVVAGTDIGVDNTDPSNPIISTTTPLTSLVPYAAATADVDLGAFRLITPTLNSITGTLTIAQTSGSINQNPQIVMSENDTVFSYSIPAPANSNGGTFEINGGNGAVSAGNADSNGGAINIRAGDAVAGTNNNGGDVVFVAGNGFGGGVGGTAALIAGINGIVSIGVDNGDIAIRNTVSGPLFYQFSTGFQILFSPPTLTANRTVTYQDKSGTLAFLSDLSPLFPNTTTRDYTVTAGNSLIVSQFFETVSGSTTEIGAGAFLEIS